MVYWNMSEVEFFHLAQWTRKHSLHPACWNILSPLDSWGLFLSRCVLDDGKFWLLYLEFSGQGRFLIFHLFFQLYARLPTYSVCSCTFFAMRSSTWCWVKDDVAYTWEVPPMQSNCLGRTLLSGLQCLIFVWLLLLSHNIVRYNFQLSVIGSPSITGLFVSTIKSSSSDPEPWSYLHWRWMVQIFWMMVLL